MRNACKMIFWVALVTIMGTVVCHAAGSERFIVHHGNGTVLDTKTNLMWSAKDNGSDINWEGAKSYCENFFAGGYRDWRLPTPAELATLYETGESRPAPCAGNFTIHVATPLIEITCFAPWTSEIQGNDAAQFSFVYGTKALYLKSNTYGTRALPVRNSQ